MVYRPYVLFFQDSTRIFTPSSVSHVLTWISCLTFLDNWSFPVNGQSPSFPVLSIPLCRCKMYRNSLQCHYRARNDNACWESPSHDIKCTWFTLSTGSHRDSISWVSFLPWLLLFLTDIQLDLIHVMENDILPYVVFLIVPVLGRMSDADNDVRLIATTTFATLVKLVPLEVCTIYTRCTI